jgi:prevent-host-death family protein
MEMNATAFKARCLEIMDRVSKTREEVIITKRGRPVARILPVVVTEEAPLFGSMKGMFQFKDKDLLMPSSTISSWTVLEDNSDD